MYYISSKPFLGFTVGYPPGISSANIDKFKMRKSALKIIKSLAPKCHISLNEKYSNGLTYIYIYIYVRRTKKIGPWLGTTC